MRYNIETGPSGQRAIEPDLDSLCGGDVTEETEEEVEEEEE